MSISMTDLKALALSCVMGARKLPAAPALQSRKKTVILRVWNRAYIT